jgi:hypothetical protein
VLTEKFYVLLASWLKAPPEGGALYLAVGSGQPAWDRQPPPPSRGAARLENETFRKRIEAHDAVFLDAGLRESAVPTARLLFRATLAPSEALGTLRESGLFAGAAGPERDSGALISYVTYAAVAKTADLELERFVRLDLTPRNVDVTVPPQVPPPEPRYLGNSRSLEFHDSAHVTSRCRINLIRADHRQKFATVEAALASGYDYCGFCFPAGLSKR